MHFIIIYLNVKSVVKILAVTVSLKWDVVISDDKGSTYLVLIFMLQKI